MENQEINLNTDNQEAVEVVDQTIEQAQQPMFTQSEVDRLISKTAEKIQAKFERQMKQQQSLANLDEKERAIAEKDLRLQEMEERLAQFELMETKQEITKVLAARGMSAELVDFVATTTDVMECQQKIDTLDRIVKQMVRAEVEKRMSTTTPRASVSNDTGAITKEKFARMTLAEKSELARNDIELYKQLSQR